jgi:glycosyltransferase involved in cell wall biosynthesis
MKLLDVSVVMSAYNNADTLPGALESILSQEGVDLEFIVIDDGSTDGSGKILSEAAARDSRVRVVHKRNEGLTRALIDGCAMAKAPWIARQDADDVSLPGRLKAQLDRAQQNDKPVLVTCGALWQTEDGIALFESLAEDDVIQLKSRILNDGKSICAHGTAFFSKSAYDSVGGYREQFYYAQDLDLFTRMAKIGNVASVPQVCYAYTFSPTSISTHAAGVQRKFRAFVQRDDIQALEDAKVLSAKVRAGGMRKSSPFAGYYFIGSCLLRQDPKTAAAYFRKALACRPWSLRASMKFMLCSRNPR